MAPSCSGELSRIEQELFEADWRAAKDRLLADGDTREPTLADLDRTGAQRRADALVEMATRSAACPDGARRPAPLFSVLVNYEELHGRTVELANGCVVTPGSLLRYLEGADIERAVFTGDNRVDIGPTNRFFTGATRRALELRDRECAHPTCARALRAVPGRPHRGVLQGRAHHPGERPAALPLPQPAPEPAPEGMRGVWSGPSVSGAYQYSPSSIRRRWAWCMMAWSGSSGISASPNLIDRRVIRNITMAWRSAA